MSTTGVLGAKRGPGQTRELVRRRMGKGLTLTQIGAEVGVSRQAVRKHVDALEAEAAANGQHGPDAANPKRFGNGAA